MSHVNTCAHSTHTLTCLSCGLLCTSMSLRLAFEICFHLKLSCVVPAPCPGSTTQGGTPFPYRDLVDCDATLCCSINAAHGVRVEPTNLVFQILPVALTPLDLVISQKSLPSLCPMLLSSGRSLSSEKAPTNRNVRGSRVAARQIDMRPARQTDIRPVVARDRTHTAPRLRPVPPNSSTRSAAGCAPRPHPVPPPSSIHAHNTRKHIRATMLHRV